MILEEATYEAFGYYPSDLTRKSDKLVISYCKMCGGVFRKNEYINGNSYLPYCSKFNIAFKRRIRARFGNKCFLCSKTREENGCALSVHHVNYNKNAGCDNTGLLCVPLCHDCCTKTNTNRALWQKTIIQKLRGKGEEKEK